ncbi:flagellar hook-length control protein FliK [Pseudomonas kairouanensis]|uniref:Flagellar hook-length control protein FliK n=1 Tax=Pseudomonas kairouanensis TaxID=2293832 RepID=A0A4Z0ALA0_9PSED|nr:type III secretion system HrpP C-terminal domain-containing protein [Pseudomonas kairouanensis]TFY86929.1 flagellar hook-length control protein FliK [Pseudomonas kairouanensis]
MTQVASSKTERPPRDERESGPGVVLPWEQQGRLFSQLFAGEGKREGSSRSLGAAKATADLALVEAFAEQLVPRLTTATQWPLQAAFFLPRLGRVDVSVRREQGAWHLEMAAEEERTRAWLGGLRQHCQDRLSADLGGPVHLSLADAVRS